MKKNLVSIGTFRMEIDVFYLIILQFGSFVSLLLTFSSSGSISKHQLMFVENEPKKKVFMSRKPTGIGNNAVGQVPQATVKIY